MRCGAASQKEARNERAARRARVYLSSVCVRALRERLWNLSRTHVKFHIALLNFVLRERVSVSVAFCPREPLIQSTILIM